jgi:hypothetical protein
MNGPQLSLFELSAIHCSQCGAELRNLIDLRQLCFVTKDIHQVSNGNYMTLYRNTHGVVLT